jgi:hypothetical protein
MGTYAHTLYVDSEFGIPQDLPKAGVSLENPYAYDATAREIKSMEQAGRAAIVNEHVSFVGQEPLIDRLTFIRLR